MRPEPPISDVFQRIEQHVVSIGERLEESRRYRPLAAEAERLYVSSMRVARRVREAARQAGGGDAGASALESEIESLAERVREMLAGFTEGALYRDLVAALEGEDHEAAARLLPQVFDGIEAAAPEGSLYLPLAAKRGETMLDPTAAADRVAAMVTEGIAPQHAPGSGGDANINPIRFYEGLVGLDTALLVIVDGADLPAPSFRAVELGEILVYRRRLRVPLTIGLRRTSPDDWLEVRAGGYETYRERCREELTARGLAITDL